MSTNLKAPGGSTEGTGGADESEIPTNESDKPSTVAREAYEKVLTEAKEAKKRLAAFEAEEKKRKEADLEKNQEFQKLADTYKKEAEEWKGKFDGLNTNLLESRKLAALQGKLSGKLPSEYWGLVDLDQIAHDPDSGKVDDASVARYAKEFEKKHSRLIDKPTTSKLPNDAAKGGANSLSYAEWLKLPLKEQKERMKDVDSSTL